MLDNLFHGTNREVHWANGVYPLYDTDIENTVYYLNEEKKVKSQKGKPRITIPYFVLKVGPNKIPNIYHTKKNSKITKSMIATMNAKVDQLIQSLKEKAGTDDGNVLVSVNYGNVQSGEEPDTMELECRIGITFTPFK